MRKSLTIAALGLGLAGAASAQGYGYSDYGYGHNDYRAKAPYAVDHCAKQKRDGQTGGAIVGGLIGAVAGGAIGNNIDNDDHYYRRGHRGYRGYGYGYRPRHHRHRKNDNSGNVAAGAIIGGLIGAVAGSEVGKKNVNCRTYHDSIPLHGYRGDPSIAPPTRQPWPEQTRSYPVSQPTTAPRSVRTYPAPPRSQTEFPDYGRSDDLYGGRQQCETLTRVTRLPDGREIREQVQDCDQGEVYYERNGRRVQGGY